MTRAFPTDTDGGVSPQAWRRLSHAVYEINHAASHSHLCEAVISAMQRLVKADVYTFQALHRETGRSILRMLPEGAFLAEEIAYYFAEPEAMPLVAYYAQTDARHARRLSDVIPTRDFLKSRYYEKCLSRLGLAYAMAMPVHVDEVSVIGLSINRAKRDFTIKDRALLDAFGPHVAQAWQRHGDPWATGEPGRPSPRRYWAAQGLTPRECDVLLWMTEGKQNGEIGLVLGISLATVQKHVACIVRKLQAENRHAATVIALRATLPKP